MKVLFITYNGLTSHIGRAQVWPYLHALAGRGHDIHIISYEARGVDAAHVDAVARETDAAGIHWTPQYYSSLPGPLAKLIDLLSLRRAARRAVANSGPFDLVHCRSYVPADAAMQIKHTDGTRFLFDMRALWADQRAEGERWPQHKPMYRWLYRWWKHKEARYAREADAIVALTEASRQDLATWPSYRGAPIHVIPCSVNIQQFSLLPLQQRAAVRASIGIVDDRPVFAYLGSLGSFYLLDDMIRSFAAIKEYVPEAMFLLIGHQADWMLQRAIQLGVALQPDDIRGTCVPREQVPALLNAADAGFCFYKPGYYSIAVSPTKLGEYFACGLPVICNAGVGDVEAIVKGVGAGVVLAGDLGEATRQRIAEIQTMLTLDRAGIRARAVDQIDLETAVSQYDRIYRTLGG